MNIYLWSSKFDLIWFLISQIVKSVISTFQKCNKKWILVKTLGINIMKRHVYVWGTVYVYQGRHNHLKSTEPTVWTFLNFSASQIFRETNFRDPRRSKTAILTYLEALNFNFGEFRQIQSIQNCNKMAILCF